MDGCESLIADEVDMKNMISPATPRSLIITAISLAVFVSFRESHAQNVLNVDLDSGTATSKTGLAATGQTGTDFWNFYSRDDGQGGWRTLGGVANLKYANGVSSSVGLIVLNAPGSWGNGSSDPMFNGYLYPFSGNATLSVTNLPPGSYNFYIYGPDGTYQVTVSGT